MAAPAIAYAPIVAPGGAEFQDLIQDELAAMVNGGTLNGMPVFGPHGTIVPGLPAPVRVFNVHSLGMMEQVINITQDNVLRDLFENPNRPIRRAINKYLFCGRLSARTDSGLIQIIQRISTKKWRRDQFSPAFPEIISR